MNVMVAIIGLVQTVTVREKTLATIAVVMEKSLVKSVRDMAIQNVVEAQVALLEEMFYLVKIYILVGVVVLDKSKMGIGIVHAKPVMEKER